MENNMFIDRSSEFDMTTITTDCYKYSPKEDITVYELALILPLFHSNSSIGFNMGVENLPEWVKRHFKKI